MDSNALHDVLFLGSLCSELKITDVLQVLIGLILSGIALWGVLVAKRTLRAQLKQAQATFLITANDIFYRNDNIAETYYEVIHGLWTPPLLTDYQTTTCDNHENKRGFRAERRIDNLLDYYDDIGQICRDGMVEESATVFFSKEVRKILGNPLVEKYINDCAIIQKFPFEGIKWLYDRPSKEKGEAN